MNYSAQAIDGAGIFRSVHRDNFASCLCAVRDLAREFPDKMVLAFNLDEVDVDVFDGLTDEEREAVAAAIDEGHRLASIASERTGT